MWILVIFALITACFLHTSVDAACVAYSRSAADGGIPGHIYLNASLLPNTFVDDLGATCPAMANQSTVCCHKLQYESMKARFQLLNENFHGCPACVFALRNMWCHFTCSNQQSDWYVILSNTSEGKVESVQLNVSQSAADRVWQACENAVMGGFTVGRMFPDVEGLFAVQAGFSPSVDNHPMIAAVVIDTYPGDKPLNFSTINDRYQCASGLKPPSLVYPLPKAMLGGLPLEVGVGLVLGAVLLLTGGVGLANSRWMTPKGERLDSNDEELEQDEVNKDTPGT